jgi:hypothetical protein
MAARRATLRGRISQFLEKREMDPPRSTSSTATSPDSWEQLGYHILRRTLARAAVMPVTEPQGGGGGGGGGGQTHKKKFGGGGGPKGETHQSVFSAKCAAVRPEENASNEGYSAEH